MTRWLTRSNRASQDFCTWLSTFANIALASVLAMLVSFALPATARAAVTGDPSEFSLCPINFTPPGGASLLCSHSETTGGQHTIGNSTVPISNNPDTVDLGAYSNSGLGLFGVEVIVTPTNGQVFGGPAQVVPGGLLGLSGLLAPAFPAARPDQRSLGLDRAGRSDYAGNGCRPDRHHGVLLRWRCSRLLR